MPTALKLYIIGLVSTAALATVSTSLAVPIDGHIALTGGLPPSTLDVIAGIAFWTAITLLASAIPIRLPGGTLLALSTAPIIVAMNLGGPTVAAWVALIGSTEAREIRGRIPWYGTLANHAGIALPAIVGGLLMQAIGGPKGDVVVDCIRTIVGAGAFYLLNNVLADVVAALRTGQSVSSVLSNEVRTVATNFLALAPMAWLMARMYQPASAGWWATLLFALPMYMTRIANQASLDMREMFTQTIQSLANAVDKRDPFTANHSHRVMLIASDIGRQMKCNSKDMEALEWGGLLHDIGKIGVRDEILLKQDKLTREERTKMNAHPVLGAEIIAPVRRLAPELPIIRHHHEWFNGSGYPDRLLGDEIPRLARILHVADAFEAMTAQRPYRMTPLSNEQAMSELRKFAGIQFDPVVVDAFSHTPWAEGVLDPGGATTRRVIPLLSQEGARIAQMSDAGQADYASPTSATVSVPAVEVSAISTVSKAG
jgi:putative nucleotidyltransferase with HDIG domain